MTHAYKEYRCFSCKKLLFRGAILEGEIEVKCKRCQNLTTIHTSSLTEYLCGIVPCPRRIPIPKKENTQS